MASQRLETIISINARAEKGFAEVGNTLTELGSLVSGMSDQILQFGKDSVEVYKDYEKSMTDAEVALSTTYGRGTAELSEVMKGLDSAATEWAVSTIFHTNDVANAISEAAHAGWDYDKIMTGIPAAMELAQAGSIDLSDAVNYIVKATNAAGISFEDTSDFIDKWTYSANSSATTVEEMGEAMLKMGATMKFAGGTEEFLTLIAATANAGVTGSEAGTMVRNSMLRLIAPTKKAGEALESLGATEEELAEISASENLEWAGEQLSEAGFSVYDEQGNLRNMIDIYSDLNTVLSEMAGGADKIAENEDTMKILSAIFPTRTITEALGLMDAAEKGWYGLYDDLENGVASNYGEYAAETMMDTLYGNIETFGSKVERLKQLTGEELSTQVSDFLGGVGDIVDSISEMDSGSFSALVAGLETIALAGPGLLIAGGAFRFIAAAMTPAGGIGLTAIALVSAAKAVRELEDADFASKFGTGSLDHAAINSFTSSLTDGFNEAYSEINSYKQALDEAVASYQNASSKFTSKLFTSMITGAQLSSEEIDQMKSMGESLGGYVLEGLESSMGESVSYWSLLFGGEDNEEYGGAFTNAFDMISNSYNAAVSTAEGIGNQLRDAMNSAFADGEISPEEYSNILSYVQSYNQALAEAASEAAKAENEVNLKAMLHKAQTASLDEIKSVSQEITEARDSVIAQMDDEYETNRARLELNYDKQIEAADNAADKAFWTSQKNMTLAAADSAHKEETDAWGSQYDSGLYNLWDKSIRQGDLGGMFENLETLAQQVMQGQLSTETAYEDFKWQYGGSNKHAGEGSAIWDDKSRQELSEAIAYEIDSLGGVDTINQRIADYTEQGDAASANQLQTLLTMQQISDNFATTTVKSFDDFKGSFLGNAFATAATWIHGGSEYMSTDAHSRNYEDHDRASYENLTLESARQTISDLNDAAYGAFFNSFSKETNGGMDEFSSVLTSWGNFLPSAKSDLESMMNGLSQKYDYSAVLRDYDQSGEWQGYGFGREYATYQLMYGEAAENAEQYKITVTPEIDQGAMESLDPVILPVLPEMTEEEKIDSLEGQGVSVEVDGDTTSLEATINGSDGQTLLEYVNGEASGLQMSITDQDGKTLVENVTGNASSLASIISSYDGRTITVNIAGRQLFASGGRATTASIFGEAGPEWAIPEQHSERTAQLLNAAREASGFTWPDLLARFGGMNASANNQPSTVVYSPTINAADVTGVEQALRDDKARLDKWFREKKMFEQVEVFT
ncbi:MAG: phage tail tape measure protein [Lachnospiraceae bacterium]|nr:phage tail tape measure protein [Lachnospiraceae bacterium]